MNFELDDEQEKKYEKWYNEVKHPYSGSIGGAIEFVFIPTGIGNIVIVRDKMLEREIDLTDYKNI